MATPNFDLYLVTDRRQTRGRDLATIVELALAGGAKAVQLREKDLGGNELFHLAEKLKKRCDEKSATLLINDRIDVALAVDADGVQLGSGSLPIAAARGLLGASKLIGASTHSLEEAIAARKAGADFILFGPVYFTPSKAAYGEPQGLALLKEVVEKISLPVYAIGGINPDNAAEAKRTGIRGVALISAVMSAEDPRAAASNIIQLIGR